VTRIIRIEDPEDPRIAAYRNVRDRDLARGGDTFIAEGKVVLSVLFGAGRFPPLSALVLANRLDGVQDVLASAPADMPVYVASQPVMDAIAGFHIHRGILALAQRTASPPPAALLTTLPADALVVVLVGIANHDNVGAIFRNAAAFEADAVLLDETCCDPLYRKAIRVSVGAALKVPFARGGSASELADDLAQNGFNAFALSPSGRESLAEVSPSGRTAILLGTEGEGLPPSLMQRLRTVRIPMSESFDSLNVATASAIALHRLGRFRD
jgi:tRNA G18 (ribose-2'-O)-methylase SpoU